MDNEKMIKEILKKVEGGNTSKEKLEKILCDTIRNYNVSKIQPKEHNSSQILEDYKIDMESLNYSNNTIKNKLYALNKMFKFINKDIQDITIIDLKAYLNYKKDNCKSSSVNTLMSTIKAFFTWCYNEEYIPKNPSSKLKKIKQEYIIREPLSIEGIERLRINCRTIRERALVEFLLATGMRVSEIQKVNVSDLNFDSNKLKTLGKGNKERVVLFNDRCKLYIKEYLNKRAAADIALFVSERSPYKRLSVRAIQKILKNISLRKDFEYSVFPHKLRHTFATNMFRQGADLKTVQFLLGHKNISTTQIYTKTNIDDITFKYNKYFNI